ncbi:iron complex transport system substrate-binding protein [Paenibacillus algorifonticola]|uniref:Iron complex transport system substrate-binding protein n=1 Tax=Paenibacillus algorifonticola TaxID=684063 RepID=A0A1I2FQZ6_9BACL|nr:ABC transporter substrate-binding protein [Paenibacillus algorifonticola]SFF07715.1 iron complex transport system substrate-binding protein [Paenibacillus algorifonticola]
MRTKMIFIASMLVIMLVVTACGQSGAANQSNPAEAAEPAAPVEEAQTRKVTTVNGEVEIPVNPQRIVATYYLGELAALGIKPVGTVDRQLGKANPNLASYSEGVASIGDFPPNLEAIAALEPDLIIATDFDNIEYADYSKIAPTIVIPWTTADVATKLRSIAAFLDKDAEAEAFIQEMDANAAKAREAIKDDISKEETVAIIRFFGKSIRVYGGRDIGHALYHSLELTPTPIIKQAMEQNPNFTSTEDVSLEQISEYAADRIFVVVSDEEADSQYNELQKLAIWANLPAVKNNKVYKIQADKWFAYDPISINVTVEDAVRILTGEDDKG